MQKKSIPLSMVANPPLAVKAWMLWMFKFCYRERERLDIGTRSLYNTFHPSQYVRIKASIAYISLIHGYLCSDYGSPCSSICISEKVGVLDRALVSIEVVSVCDQLHLLANDNHWQIASLRHDVECFQSFDEKLLSINFYCRHSELKALSIIMVCIYLEGTGLSAS